MNTQHRPVLLLTAIVIGIFFPNFAIAQDDDNPHVVIVVGTLHYSPELTMPVFAKELERFGVRTTVVVGKGNPEAKSEDVLPGIGLRTSNHSFKYPQGHPRFQWNDGFGRRALGTPYVVHQTSETKISVIETAVEHPVMTNVPKHKWVSPGTLYLTRLENGCVPLVTGSGDGRARTLKKAFGTVEVKPHETDVVAWAWENEWGGKVFGTSFGHPGDFAEESFMRMLVNAVFWTLDRPLPGADQKISTWKIQRVDKKPKK